MTLFFIGDSKLGIYVCKHADVQLKLAETWRVDKCHIIVCKVSIFIFPGGTVIEIINRNTDLTDPCFCQVMYGKCKMVTPQVQTGGNMEPTPNFDCHISQDKPNPNDPLELQITKSMVYIRNTNMKMHELYNSKLFRIGIIAENST